MSEVAQQLRQLGIERGWGGTVGRIKSTMLMLGDIIQAPDPETLQASLPALLSNCPYIHSHNHSQRPCSCTNSHC